MIASYPSASVLPAATLPRGPALSAAKRSAFECRTATILRRSFASCQSVTVDGLHQAWKQRIDHELAHFPWFDLRRVGCVEVLTAQAQAQPNIALVKYWGKRDVPLNLPERGSLSVTLDALWTRTRVTFDREFVADRILLDGHDYPQGQVRASACLDTLRELAGSTLRGRVDTRNNFPTAAGLASSASGFAALVLAGSAALGLSLNERELSILARRASGSAARSIFGGFVEMSAGAQTDGADAYASPLLDALQWRLCVVVAVTSNRAKAVNSSRGMDISRNT